MTPSALRSELLVPLMTETGERWRRGTLRIAHEHLASSVVRSFLGAISLRARTVAGPRIILTTPVGSDHEFGALIAAHCAAEVGWDPVFLGPTLPAAEIAAAARVRKASAVGLSIVFPPSNPAMHDELRLIRELLDDDVELLVGGPTVDGYRETLAEIRAHPVRELAEFQSTLEKISGDL
jgi:methylmalonyl-CoA mutase cobalamin-binding subunit